MLHTICYILHATYYMHATCYMLYTDAASAIATTTTTSTASSVAGAIRRELSPDQQSGVQLKWPNDILLRGCKVCGTLIQIRDRVMLVVGWLSVEIIHCMTESHCL